MGISPLNRQAMACTAPSKGRYMSFNMETITSMAIRLAHRRVYSVRCYGASRSRGTGVFNLVDLFQFI